MILQLELLLLRLLQPSIQSLLNLSFFELQNFDSAIQYGIRPFFKRNVFEDISFTLLFSFVLAWVDELFVEKVEFGAGFGFINFSFETCF